MSTKIEPKFETTLRVIKNGQVVEEEKEGADNGQQHNNG
jgi:hypothetical protein